MKKPVPPPPWRTLLAGQSGQLGRLLSLVIGPEVAGRYEHWDHLRHLTPPEGLSHDQWWLAIKLSRNAVVRRLPLTDKAGHPIGVVLADSMLERLHTITREASGSIRGLDRMEDENERERYLMRSHIEEAITSSQLEGAGTTRAVAKQMLQNRRAPRDHGERMIFNNHAVMQELKRWKDRPLTPQSVFEIHRLLTTDTLEDPTAAGRFRNAEENIQIEDETGQVLHVPPPASELPSRMQALCDFANGVHEQGFLHPVVRAIAIHFQVGYDHPFVDGNGRTARTLFYWSMLRSGYWMIEYLSISNIFTRAKAQYLRSYLCTETDDSDLSYFVDHHLDVIVKAIDQLHDYLARKAQQRRQAESLLRPVAASGMGLNHRQRELLLDAVRHPDRVYRIDHHRGIHGVTYQTARNDLLTLAEKGLLQQFKEGKAYVFTPSQGLARLLRS